MKITIPHAIASRLSIALLPLFLVSMPVHAEGHWRHGEHADCGKSDNGQAWMKLHMEKEAFILEIKPSQEAAWEEYAAVKLEIASSFAEKAHDMQPRENLDPAGLLRKRADHMVEAAKSLTRLADATEKLQAVLSAEQQTVLKRLVAHHDFHQHARHAHKFEHSAMKHSSASAPAGKPQPQKSK